MILTCLSPGAYAQDGNLKMSPEEAAERVSLSFMQNTLDPNVEISSTIPFYDLNNNVTAYCVSFELNGAPNGYVLISLLNMEMPIVEFALEGNGIYDLIQVPQNSRNSATLTLPVIRYLGPGLLFVEDSVSNTLYNVETQKSYSESQIKNSTVSVPTMMNNVDIAKGILFWDDSDINLSSLEQIPSFGEGEDYWLLKDFDEDGNVCSPTCATNILWYWAHQQGRMWCIKNMDTGGQGYFEAVDIFDEISAYMFTFPPLGTLNALVENAYIYFLTARTNVSNGEFNTRSLTDNNYADFTVAIDNDCPIHTMLRNENIFSTGHDVMTFGYGESNRGVKYLFVMDGWDDYGRFVYFDYYPIVKGIKVWVGEDS